MSETQTLINELKDGAFICTRNEQFPNLRKIVFLLNTTDRMHIHSLTCTCNNSYKHKSYYYEWAL